MRDRVRELPMRSISPCSRKGVKKFNTFSAKEACLLLSYSLLLSSKMYYCTQSRASTKFRTQSTRIFWRGIQFSCRSFPTTGTPLFLSDNRCTSVHRHDYAVPATYTPFYKILDPGRGKQYSAILQTISTVQYIFLTIDWT